MVLTSDKRKIVCPYYKAPPEGRRCVHYTASGDCVLSGNKCTEWLRVNDPVKDLLGLPVEEPKPSKRRKAAASPSRVPTKQVPIDHFMGDGHPSLRGLTAQDIADFKKLGVEVCLQSDDFGELWLVPAYTNQDRTELIPEHAATLARVLDVFPGARVKRFGKASGEKTGGNRQ